MARVEAREVRVDLDGRPALSPVSLSVRAGRCLGITGDNGSGKTTLLRVLAGLQPPTDGEAVVHGRPCDERDRHFRRRVAAHIGSPPVARDLTLDEQLRLVARTWGLDAGAAARRALDLVAELGLARLAGRFPHQLSAGQAHLFTLALVLCRPSTVLILDEPEHRLDDSRVGTVIEALRARRSAGTTLLMATHDPRFLEALGDEVLHLETAT